MQASPRSSLRSSRWIVRVVAGKVNRARGGLIAQSRSLLVALVVFLCSAAPVLADDAAEKDPPPIAVPEGLVAPEIGGPPNGPNHEEMVEILQRTEQEEERREEELAAPAAVKERKDSLRAYADLSPAQAEELLAADFPDFLASLNADPARTLSDSRLDHNLGAGDAVVTTEGKTQLLEGSYPVETQNEGKLEKVDVSLEETAEGYEAENPLVEVAIADSAAEGVVIGGEGSAGALPQIAVAQLGAEESAARPWGDKNVFFGEVGSDTDLLVSPTAYGVELASLLRTVDSPEMLLFHVDLPANTELRAGQDGGAEVVAADGKLLYRVDRPVSFDAQGSQVLTTLEVEGDNLVVQVPHREVDVAYPILVDPEVEMNWSYGNIPGIAPNGPWYPYVSGANNGIPYGTTDNYWPNQPGLYFAAQEGSLGANIWTELAYFPPNEKSYIAKAVINTFWRGDWCPLVKDPYDFAGMYTWNNGGTPETPHWNGYRNNDAYNWGNATISAWGNEFIIGYGNATARWNPCWRNVRVGGTQIWLEDWDAPHLTEVSGIPTGWVKKDNTQRTINVAGYDVGLGVQSIRFISPGGKEWNWNQPSCAGTYESPCATNRSGQITYETSGFPFEGDKVPVSVQAIDPTGKKYNPWQYTMKLDGTSPTINLSGQLATITAEQGSSEKPQGEGKDELSLPTYSLKVEAQDGSASEPRSGVKAIRLYLDSSQTPLESKTQPCGAGSCPMTLNYSLALPSLSEGTHTLKIVAEDQVGNVTAPERKIEFTYIPATGMKEEYVLQHFMLPDGHEYAEEPEFHGPEIAVNVMNGNVVYHERDLNVTTPRATLELERVYNSQLPAAKDGQWGHGWTIAQSPEFKPIGGAPAQKATMVRTSAITNAVNVPQSEASPTFSPRLHATVSKTPAGGYEVAYGTEPETSVFNSSGRIEEARFGESAAASSGSLPPSSNPTFTSSFGSGGTGNGQFAHPAGVAVGANGFIWVVDENHYKVQKFTEGGEYVSSFGAQGTGNGQFGRPTDIAIDAKGNLWVTDAGNSRIEEFNEKGEYVTKFGSAGSGNGQFANPEALAIDSKGNIWVGDTYNGRVQEFNEKGEFIRVVGSAGTGQGQMTEATGIAVGPGNNVWVADWGNQRVLEFSETGSFIRQFGTEGAGNGQFKRPDVIEVDAKGNVWVGDQNNARIQQFNQTGEYVGQFGTAGTGQGQFSFGWPMGITTDNKGHLWISDTGNNRVQKWTIPNWGPTFTSSFGSGGTGNGQFAHPAGVAVGANGFIWVVDENHYKVQKFTEGGEYVSSFGAQGTGNGQFGRPTDIAIDAKGNLWVTDAGNSRIEEFNEKGEYVTKFGSAGSGNGQFANPEALAIDSKGNIWVGDTYNGRVQEFNEKGEFIRVVGSAGTGQGQMTEATGIAVGPGNNVWVADWGNQRVLEFSETGSFIRQFGTEGAGNGQFKRPDVIEVDAKGNVWVGDQNNARIQQFNQTGEYVGQFGTAGTGQGQFSFGWPMGITTDNKGHLWISDTGNNRVQKWTIPAFEVGAGNPYNPAPTLKYSYTGTNLTKLALNDPSISNDPSVNLSVSAGLTASVSGSAAGTTTYGYESSKLTAAKYPSGETKYRYDASKRLEKIELPNGTTATLAYDALSRATSVTVDPVGAAGPQTTNFWYGEQPRETKVWGGGRPEVTYSIGEDGSVFKWSYAEVAPAIDSISGSLWANRNSTTPIENKDHTLFVTGSSPHEIAKVQVVVNSEAVLAEKTCEDKATPPDHHCEHVTLEWVTHAAEHAAGQLNLEAVVTDFLGHQTAERFFVTIPQQPPPDPEAPPKPSFDQIKQFREEYGLDREHNYTEPQMTALILELLYEWELENPTAVLAVEKWGVPLRTPEVQELEFRESYIEQFAELIPDWAEEHAPTTYGGYYIDHRAGGLIYVGFTSNQAAQVEALKQISGLIAPGQIREFPTPPTTSIASAEATEESVTEYIAANQTMNNATTEVGAEPGSSTVRVGTTNPTMLSEYLTAHFGPSAPIQTYLDQDSSGAAYSRYQANGPVNPGSALMSTPQKNGNCGFEYCWNECTAGFSARAVVENREGHNVYAMFTLTAGHCFSYEERTNRKTQQGNNASAYKPLGQVRRYVWGSSGQKGTTDAEAIRIDPDIRSGNVFYGNPNSLLPIRGLTRAKIGTTLCWSGINGGTNCGPARRLHWVKYDGRWTKQVEIAGGDAEGDSGGPVWNMRTEKAVGIFTSWHSTSKHPCHDLRPGVKYCWLGGITPLMPYANRPNPPGALMVMGLELVRGDF
jgi:DNA-binding beta-propeller fold protein YncE